MDDLSRACSSAGLNSFSAYPYSARCFSDIPPLLYGISSSLCSREPYWPSSVHLCGFWRLPEQWELVPEPSLVTLVEESSQSATLIYTGYGSMESYAPNVNWTIVLGNIHQGMFILLVCLLITLQELHILSLSTGLPCSLSTPQLVAHIQ